MQICDGLVAVVVVFALGPSLFVRWKTLSNLSKIFQQDPLNENVSG